MYPSLLTSRSIAFSLILLMLAGCTSLLPGEPPVGQEIARAQHLYLQQDYLNAAAAYLALAERHKGAQRQTFLLQGADAALLGGDMGTARAALQKLGPERLQKDNQLLHRLLQAEIARQNQQIDHALHLLLSQSPAADAREDLRKRYARALADLYQQKAAPAPNEQIQGAAHIGVLLPQTGQYAKVGTAIRDGMMFSLQRMPTDQRPTLNFYDSNSTEAIRSLYHEAIRKGADFVIGPLQKDAVAQLMHLDELPVPVLALNSVDADKTTPDNLYMYALDPEDEARQVAERMWQDNKRRPIALIPDNAWGERLLNAFNQGWSSLGGGGVDSRKYNPDSYDHTKAITELLQINRSRARRAQLQRWLGRPLEFIPRRRTDVDAVFLATRAQHAAAFAPQFKYHMAGDLPIYTTSHVWHGSISRQQLADMRGIMLPDIPLIAAPDERAELAHEIPGIRGGLVRLYAMGMDAIALVPHLQRLQNNPGQSDQSVAGRTGKLYMDTSNRIQRQLVWLQLDSPVKTLGYANRPDAASHQTTVRSPEPEPDPVVGPNQTETLQVKSTTLQNHGSPTAR